MCGAQCARKQRVRHAFVRTNPPSHPIRPISGPGARPGPRTGPGPTLGLTHPPNIRVSTVQLVEPLSCFTMYLSSFQLEHLTKESINIQLRGLLSSRWPGPSWRSRPPALCLRRLGPTAPPADFLPVTTGLPRLVTWARPGGPSRRRAAYRVTSRVRACCLGIIH